MLLDVAGAAIFLLIGNIVWRHFDPFLALWRRITKVAVALVVTVVISYYFGRTGVLVAFGIALIPLIYVHGYWLPRHGVNGWTGEPREKYYALRGWPPPEAKLAPERDGQSRAGCKPTPQGSVERLLRSF